MEICVLVLGVNIFAEYIDTTTEWRMTCIPHSSVLCILKMTGLLGAVFCDFTKVTAAYEQVKFQ
jgi:hypothetical protein